MKKSKVLDAINAEQRKAQTMLDAAMTFDAERFYRGQVSSCERLKTALGLNNNN